MALPYHADFVMADPAQLRKCEELLRTLPETQHRSARPPNPLWMLLKGIEGFDTARASECLVKLLDKHYDMIGVLKLATKRDLVEDAGILPGDALRILAAAGHYEHPQDADPSDGPPPQKDGGVPIHQVLDVEHAYRPPALREKALIFTSPATSHASSHAYIPQVMQEKLKDSKGVNEAAPIKHVRDSKFAAQTHSIPDGITFPHTCGVCNVKVSSVVAIRSHFYGRKLAKKMEQAANSGDNRPTHLLHCSICNVTSACKRNLVMHFNGKKHAKNMKVDSDSGESAYYSNSESNFGS